MRADGGLDQKCSSGVVRSSPVMGRSRSSSEQNLLIRLDVWGMKEKVDQLKGWIDL